MRLLHVEDDSDDLALVRRALCRSLPDAEIESVRTIAAARAALLGPRRFDAVLLDLCLPDGNGLDLLTELREQGEGIATVVLTGDGDEAAVRAALKAGADDFLVKGPGYFEQLGQAIDAALRKAANKLIESERRFRALFEQTPSIAVQGYDRERCVIYWNQASERLYGYSADEALGRRLEDLIIPPAMRDAVVSAVEAWLDDRDQAIGAEEITLQRKDGRAVHVFSSHVMLDGPDGQPEIYCIDVDLSRQKEAASELEASEARYRQTVESLTEVIFEVDRNGSLIFLNPAWEQLSGQRVRESLGRSLTDFVHPDDRVRCEQIMGELLGGGLESCRHEFRLRRRDGSVRWLEGNAGVRRDAGVPVEVFGALMDISERVSVQRLQQARNEVLDHIVSDRPISEVIDAIIRHVESMRPGFIVAIRLFDRDTDAFVASFSRSLPDFYVESALGVPIGKHGGACGAAVRSGEVVVVEDIQSDPHWKELRALAAGAALNSCWSTPFANEAGEVLGTFAVYTRQRHVPDAAEQALVAEFVNLASVAVQKRETSETLVRRERTLAMASQVVLELLREADFDHAMNRVLSIAGQGTDVDRAYVFEVSGRSESNRLCVSLRHEWVRDGIGPQLGNPELYDVPFSDGFGRWDALFAAGRNVGGDVHDFPPDERAFLEAQQIQSILAVPIVVDNRFWGFIGFDSVRRRKRWSSVEESVLQIISTSIAAALERRASLEKLRLWATAFQSTRDGVVIADTSARIVAVNRAYTSITGYSESEVVGRNPGLIKSGRHTREFYQTMWGQLVAEGHWQGEIWNRRKNGELYPQWLNIATVSAADRKPTHYVGVMTDISELKQSEARLEHMAHYDLLTGLPNRTLALLRLERALVRANRHRHGVGVLFIDLDRFKNINDSFGHPVGDQLLRQIAERLNLRVRSEDTLARLGGDEFLLVLEQLSEPEEAGRVAEGLIGLLDKSFILPEGQEVYVGSSVGIAVFPRDGETPTQLIQHADAALYKAKAEGRKTFSYFTSELGVAAQRRLQLETRLRQGLEREEFVLHYQPKLSVNTGRIEGCEALVRWNSPELGLVSPTDFIPVAEETGLIMRLGEQVLTEACRQAVRWQAAGMSGFTVAVNLSARQLWQPRLPERMARILHETGLDPERLEVELTESVIMGQETLAAERFGQLKSLGVKLAIDDFGTGYSSLGYLKRFPIDVLKIDRSFVRDIPDDANDMEIAAAIVAMAKALRLKVVAEGVETPGQLAFLAELGCDAYQGYLFSPPLPADGFERLLRAQQAESA
jgi:diguanylate cyclase (GGDEF)-like protein/PAS domain S-box-containing protein